MTQKPAAFLDRDGTVIKDKHYLHKPEEIEFLPGAIKALKLLMDHDYDLYIVTNQSGAGRGLFDIDDIKAVHDHLLSLLKNESVIIKDIAVCPHAPEDKCQCRKPQPKMILDLIKKHGPVDKTLSFMCGDKKSDVDTGINAGIRGYLLKNKSLLEIVTEHLNLS